jgi:hypothetical protein
MPHLGGAIMMDDLQELNRLIAAHWLGSLDADEEAYLSHTRVCIGQLTHSATELARLLDWLKQKGSSALAIGQLNRRYLDFARLAAKDAIAGRPDTLVRLGITLKHAQWLSKLTDDELDRLAFDWGRPLVEITRRAFQRGVGLHARARKEHAGAFVAARPSSQEARRS